jgi:hypothetical protein
MYKRFVLIVALATVAAVQSQAQTENVFVEGFEINDVVMSGGSVVGSYGDMYTEFDAPALEGEWALYVEYDATTSNYWSQASLSLVGDVDLTGVTELRFSLYFMEDSTTNSNGQVPLRSHLPPDDGLSMDYITPGEWYEVTMPIDPYRSANEMTSLTQIRMVISAGMEGSGSFLVDNIYGVRPTNPLELEIVPLYGFNSTNPGESTPLGWTRDQAELAPSLGAEYITPSEGANCMLIPVTANGVRSVRTIDAKNDIDWTRVRAIYMDACVTSDFSTWLTIHPYLASTSGGTVVPMEFRGISGNLGTWRPIGFWLDLGPHMESIIGDGEFYLGIRHDNGSDANTPDGQHVLIDNIRVGMVSTFCLTIRSFSDNTVLYEGQPGTVDVTLKATMKGEAGTVTIRETLPEGWSATGISNGGTLEDGVITWELEIDPETPVNLTYTAASAGDLDQLPVWSGTANGDPVFGTANPSYFTQSVSDTKVEAPKLTNTVTLDGIISAGEYDGANVYTFDHDTTGGNSAPGVHISGTSYPADVENVTFHIFHDDEYIYVALDVVDPDLSFEYADNQFWNADSTELYFDGNLTRSNSIESDRFGCQLTVVGDGRIAASNNKYFPEMLDAPGGGKYMEDGRDGETLPIYWAVGANVKDDGSGFVVEYRIVKETILDPADRTQIGFDVMMNSSDSANPTVRTGKWGWHCTDSNGAVFEPYNNESGWTLLELLDDGTAVQDWNLFQN